MKNLFKKTLLSLIAIFTISNFLVKADVSFGGIEKLFVLEVNADIEERIYEIAYVYTEDGIDEFYVDTQTTQKTITLRSEPKTNTNIIFTGWKNCIDGRIYGASEKCEIYSNVVFTMIYKDVSKPQNENSLTITYNATEGKGAPSAQSCYQGEYLKLTTEIPIREGFKFLGWTGSEGEWYSPGGRYQFFNSRELYANWALDSDNCMCIIQYNANGGIGAPESQEVTKNELYILSEVLPTRDGYKFINWEDENGKNWAPGTRMQAYTDKKFYAQWREESYSIFVNNVKIYSDCRPGETIYVNKESAQHHFVNLPSEAKYLNNGGISIIMPKHDVYLTSIYRSSMSRDKEYKLYINGTLRALYEEGEIVSIDKTYFPPNTINQPLNYTFSGGPVDAKVIDGIYTFRMPNKDVRVTIYSQEKYKNINKVFVNGMSIGDYLEGEKVIIKPPFKGGGENYKWIGYTNGANMFRDENGDECIEVYMPSGPLHLDYVSIIPDDGYIYDGEVAICVNGTSYGVYKVGQIVSITPPEGREYHWKGGPVDAKVIDGSYTFRVPGDNSYIHIFASDVYTIRYDANVKDGTKVENMPSIQKKFNDNVYIPGVEITISEKIPTREGYEFDSWSDGRWSVKPGQVYELTENVTLKAIWKPKTYTITFDSVGGGYAKPITAKYGETINLPIVTNPPRTLAGWGTYGKFTHTVTGNATLKAIWIIN